MSNLAKRILASIILAPLFIFIIYKGGIPFFIMVMLLFFGMFYEWVGLAKKIPQTILWSIFGFFYIGIACLIMTIISVGVFRMNFLGIENFPKLLFGIILLVWINDICSYVFGKSAGGPKLAPKISPNKTWAGAIGGLVGCVAFFFIGSYLTGFGAGTVGDKEYNINLALHILVPIVAQIGDLFESYIKRKAGVKDSGNIIPGHGGLLDRFDGLLLVLNVTGFIFFVILALQVSKQMAVGV